MESRGARRPASDRAAPSEPVIDLGCGTDSSSADSRPEVGRSLASIPAARCSIGLAGGRGLTTSPGSKAMPPRFRPPGTSASCCVPGTRSCRERHERLTLARRPRPARLTLGRPRDGTTAGVATRAHLRGDRSERRTRAPTANQQSGQSQAPSGICPQRRRTARCRRGPLARCGTGTRHGQRPRGCGSCRVARASDR